MRKQGVAVVLLCFGCGGGAASTGVDGGGGGSGDSTGSSTSGDSSSTSDAAGKDGGEAGATHTIGGCTMFPAGSGSRDDYSYWNQDISGASVDANSAAYMASMGVNTLHPDFGSDPAYGIPFDTVASTQPRVAMSFDVSDESDPGPYPFPPSAPIEAGDDHHVLVIDRDACVLYETDASSYDAASNTWSAFSGAKFDLTTGALRTETWTSADASGGPILIGLARYEEVAAGRIDHALRFTAHRTQKAYIHPATHEAGISSQPDAPPMGLRVRIKPSSCAALLAGAGTSHPEAKVIVQALCTYGMILADNGSNYYVSGATDPRWNDDDVGYLKTISSTDMEAIETGSLIKN